MSSQINEFLDGFKSELGLFPVFLTPRFCETTERYILLNGAKNNLCFDFSNDFDADKYRSCAWSANTNGYLNIRGDKSYLYSLDKKNSEEIRTDLIIDNLTKFYNYISKKRFSHDAIVEFTLNVFHKLRNSMRDANGKDSLRALLYLLSSADCDGTPDYNVWGVPQETSSVIAGIDSHVIGDLTYELKQGLTREKLTTDIKLLLRHSSGKLFEEANLIAQFPEQYELFPNNYIKYDYGQKQFGAYYTPPYVSRSIVEESFKAYGNPNKIKIFDPACGSGEFLVESLRQLKMDGYKGNVEIIGWDISETAVDLAKYLLTFEKRDWPEKLTFNIEKKDSLAEKWPDDCDYIFMNPPYSSWEQMDESQKENVRMILGDNASKPNLSAVFYYKATQSIVKHGVIGCVAPSSMMVSESNKFARESSRDNGFVPLVIGRLGSLIFDNALVYSYILIAAKGIGCDTTKVMWSRDVDGATTKALSDLRKFGTNSINPINAIDTSVYSVKNTEITTDLWSPLSHESYKIKKTLENLVDNGTLKRVKDLFDVKQGVRTGMNKILVIDSVTYKSYSPKERRFFRPSVDSFSLRNSVLSKINYLFYPYSDTIQEINITTEEELKKGVPQYYENVLLPNKNKLRERKSLPDPNKWWSLSRPRDWQMKHESKFVSTEFGSAGNFGLDITGEFVVERGCAWFPKVEFDFDSYYAYLAIMNSPIMNKLLEIYSKQLMGCYNLDGKGVNTIPIPDISMDKYNEVRGSLIETGKKMIDGKEFDDSVVNGIVKMIYCINDD